LGALFYARRVEPDEVEVVELTLPLPRLTSSFDGYRIVHISDIHMDDCMNFECLKRLFLLINEQSADLVTITGDFVTRKAELKGGDLARALSMLEATDGVAAVLGNHDHDNNPTLIRRLFREADVFEAENEFRTVKRGGEALQIAGVDDFLTRRSRLWPILEGLPEEGAVILLAHEPDFADASTPTRLSTFSSPATRMGAEGGYPSLEPYTCPLMPGATPRGSTR
jgi:predicted MPP superfamily phosphohydrolase